MTDLLVVGAGPAGLTAAWRAARRGLDVRVVEATGGVGGLAAGTTVAGQRVDLGSHRLHPTTSVPLLAALRELLGHDLQWRRRHGRLRLAGRWVGFPLRPLDLLTSLPPGFALRAARDGALIAGHRARAGAGAGADTYAEVVRARLGPTMLDGFYGPYARKLWGVAPAELSGEVARRRISARGPGSLARRVAAPRTSPRRGFWYPARGYGQIAEALADAAVAAGARIDLRTTVEALRSDADGCRVATDDGIGTTVGRVLWTAPPGALGRVLHGTDAALVTALGRLRQRAVVVVYLVLDRPRFSAFDAHYLPDPAVATSRLSEPKNYRSGPDPPDRTVLCAELPCWADGADPLWTADDPTLAHLVLDGLARSDLHPPTPAAVEVRRLPRVYPVYELATAPERARVDRWTRRPGRVVVLGRQGTFVADNLHHVMAMGWEAGELTAAGWDDARWAAARDRFDAHVVED